MELYKEILAHALVYGEIQVTFSGEEPDILKIVEGECYKALQKIKTIIEDDSLEDKECFMKIIHSFFSSSLLYTFSAVFQALWGIFPSQQNIGLTLPQTKSTILSDTFLIIQH